MAVPSSIEGRQFALKRESVRGTAETVPAYYFAMGKDDEMTFTRALIEDPARRGLNAMYPPTPGIQGGAGKFKVPCRASSIGEFIHMLCGNPTSSTEQASFVVTSASNDRIDFNIGGGNLVATIPAGTYKAGLTQATAASLCKAIYDAIVAAEAVGVYTVTYTQATGFFTITRSAGTFQLTFLTGPNTARTIAPLIGFAVTDRTGALTYTSTVVLTPPFKHVFTPGTGIQLPSYTFWWNRAMDKQVYALGQVSKLVFSASNEGHVEVEADLLCKSEALFSGSWSPSFSESPILEFYDSVTKFAGSAPADPDVKSWQIVLEGGAKHFRPQGSSALAADILAPGPFKASGSFVRYFLNETERNKFIAGTTTSVEHLVTSSQMVAGAVPWLLDGAFETVYYKAFPFGNEDEYLGAKVNWEAYYDVTNSRLFHLDITNARPSYT